MNEGHGEHISRELIVDAPFLQGKEVIRMAKDSHEPFPVDQARDQLDSFLMEQIRGLISPQLSPMMRPEYIQRRIEYMMIQIHQNVAPGFSNVFYINYTDTSFRFYDKEKREIYRANFSRLWDESNLSPQKLATIHAQVREQEEQLKRILERESLLGGSVIIEWSIAGSYIALVGDAYTRGLLSTSRRSLNVLDQSMRTIKNIWVKNPEGKLEKVYLGDRLAEYSGRGPEWVRTNTLRILQGAGVHFDPVKRTCINLGARAVESMLTTLKKMTLSEYRAKYGVNVSDTQWEKMKSSLNKAGQVLSRTGNSALSMMSWAISEGLHVVMFPVFFVQFQKQPNSATLMAGLTEWALFSLGAKAGGVVFSGYGFFGRTFGGLVGGMMSVSGAHRLYEKFDGDIKKWKLFNGQDMFSTETFAALHFATGWGVNEYLDLLNDIGPNLSEIIGTKGGFDVGVPVTDWSRYIQSLIPQKEIATLLTKYGPIGFMTGGGTKSLIGLGEGGGGILPAIDFYKRKVAFNMNPWEWFNASASPRGRTIDKWNTQVDEYVKNLKTDITKLIGGYFGKQSPFNLEKDPTILRSMLQMRIGIILMPVGEGIFNPYGKALLSAILAEVDIWNKSRSIQNISDLITQYTSFMKIDESFVRMNQLQIDTEASRLPNGEISGQIVQDFDLFASKLKNTSQQRYVRHICKRVIFGDKNLFNPDEIYSNPLSDRVRIKKSEEHKLFDSILDLVPEGKEFVQLLERLSRHCMNREFQNRIARIDQRTQKVNLMNTTQAAGNFTELNYLKRRLQ